MTVPHPFHVFLWKGWDAIQIGFTLRGEIVRLRDQTREAIARNAGMTFEIQIAGRVLFACSTLNASAGHADWIRRKRNTVMRFGKSSYAVGLQLKLEGKEFAERHEISLADYAAHGGGFPIVLKGTGLVGSVVSSGLDQRTDHVMVVQALAAVLGVEAPVLG